MAGGSCPRQAPQIWSWQWAPGAPCPTSGSPARQRRVEAGPSQAKRRSGRRGRGPCQSHRPAGGRTGASPGRGPGAGGCCSGRGRASARQPWRLLAEGETEAQREWATCPRSHSKVRGCAGFPSLLFRFRTIHCQGQRHTRGWGPSPQRHSSRRRPPPVWSSRVLKDPSPHSLTGDQPAATVRPSRPGSQPEPLSEAESFNKPGDAGLETSPCFSWAGRLLFIAAWGWRRVLQTPPVTGVFGGDEPAPENPLRRDSWAPRGLGGASSASPDSPPPARLSPALPAALSPGAARP